MGPAPCHRHGTVAYVRTPPQASLDATNNGKAKGTHTNPVVLEVRQPQQRKPAETEKCSCRSETAVR
eukprot:2018229-Rhodomonas_salina.1